jgi:hypothetical protein
MGESKVLHGDVNDEEAENECINSELSIGVYDCGTNGA